VSTSSVTLSSGAEAPPFQPMFGQPVRILLAALVAALAAAAFIFDWPFSQIGVFQPYMVTAGIVACAYVIDVPFKALWPKLLMIAAFLAAGISAWAAWYTGGTPITQDMADLAWKTVSCGLIGLIVAGGIWNAPYRNFHSKIAAIPMMFIVLFAFIGCSIWTIIYSMSDAKIYPLFTYVGLKQYYRLFKADIWTIAWHNALIYISLETTLAFVTGFLIAVFMDQKIRAEGIFRTIYLYPFALSFIVTGHVWAWILSPEYGLEKSVRQMGWTSFSFDWITNNDKAIYTVVIAGLWQGTGLVMALMIAGLRSIDDEVWKASKIDGIPKWRTYLQIVIPMMRPVLITTFVIVASGAVRLYDIVVALTDGGPGISTTVPAQYVYKYLFSGNIGQGLAAATVMLMTTAVILIPWVYIEFIKGKQQR
jgi:glucose/mannose transport system permease protein